MLAVRIVIQNEKTQLHDHHSLFRAREDKWLPASEGPCAPGPGRGP